MCAMQSFGFDNHFTCLDAALDLSSLNLHTDINDLPTDQLVQGGELKRLFDSITTLSSKQYLLQTLRREILQKLLLEIASRLKCTKIFTAETQTDLATKIIANLALGKGAHIPLDVRNIFTSRISLPFRFSIVSEKFIYHKGMATDREVLREVWDGKLPISFTLLPDQVSSVGEPDPYYLMVPRMSYFPLVLDKVKKHFVKFIDSQYQDNEMWLDYNGSPLKWHYPIGLLYDLHVSDNQLPWNITVHFDKFPANEILHCPSREAVESHFMSCIKEADVLKHRSQIVSNMQKKEHNQLWLGLQNDKFDQFWVINKKLMEAGDGGNFKHIPFRCYQGDAPFSQCLVKPATSEGSARTLQGLLEEVYSQISVEKLSVLIHGVEVPLDTPLQWLSEHLSYPDNFLHIVVNVNS